MVDTQSGKFSKKELADFKVVSKIFRKLDAAVIDTSYELGHAINDTMEHAKADKKMYDKKVIENFAKKLDGNPLSFYGMARVSRAWPVKAKFNKLTRMVHADDGWQLKWTHFVYLAHTGVARQRESLAKQAFTGKWTTGHLLSVLKKLKKVDSETRGRKAKLVPKTVEDCLKHMLTQTSRIVDLADTNWFGDGFNVITELQEKPIDTISDALIAEMNDAVAEMRSVSSSFITYAEDLSRTAQQLDERRDASAPATLYDGETEAVVPPKPPKRPGRRTSGKTGPRRRNRPGV